MKESNGGGGCWRKAFACSMKDMIKERLAIIVLTYNSTEDCRKCIGQLKLQQGITIDIIVVDNCSHDEERKKIEQICMQEDVAFIPNSENRGYAAGNNIGLRYVAKQGYRYAAICNPDMEFPYHDCLKKCLDKMVEDDSIAILAPDIVMSDGITHQNPQLDGKDNFWTILLGPYYLFMGILRHNLPQNYAEDDWETSRYCKKVVGCFFLIRMLFLERINFMDEGTFLYCEEPILARQVLREGMREYYFAETQAVHHHIRTEKGNPCHNMKLFQQSQLYLYKHYCGFSRWQFFWIWLTRKIGNSIWNLMLWIKYKTFKING